MKIELTFFELLLLMGVTYLVINRIFLNLFFWIYYKYFDKD